jgi:hypothetical protein
VAKIQNQKFPVSSFGSNLLRLALPAFGECGLARPEETDKK